MANDILEEYFFSAFASKMRTINLAEYTTLLMIMEVFSLSLSKHFPTISLVMRTIHWHVLQHLMNNRVWIFSNSWTTVTRSQVFTFLTELMSIIMATVSIPLLFRKSRDVLAFEALQTFDDTFKKFVFKNRSCRHFSFQHRQTSKIQAVGALGELSDKSDFSLLAWDSFSQEIRNLSLFYCQKSLNLLQMKWFSS